MVLQQMQMLDQQVAAPLAVAGQRLRLDLASFRMVEPAPPAGAGMDAPIVFLRLCHSRSLQPLSRMREREGPTPTAWEGEGSLAQTLTRLRAAPEATLSHKRERGRQEGGCGKHEIYTAPSCFIEAIS